MLFYINILFNSFSCVQMSKILPIFVSEAIVLNYLPPKSHFLIHEPCHFEAIYYIVCSTYCEESLLFKSPITNHTLEVPFINFVLLQCMNFVFQNNASSITEENSSTRGMMSRDRFDLIKKTRFNFL